MAATGLEWRDAGAVGWRAFCLNRFMAALYREYRPQSFADVIVVRLLCQQINRIHAYSGIEIVSRRVQKQLLDIGIAQRAMRLLRRNRIVFHRHFV